MMPELDKLSEEVGRSLCSSGLTISCAESCTGGLLTSILTDVPGSSSYVMGGIVSYSNDVKSNLLHISDDTLSVYGAVSAETAREMAEGIRNLIQTDIGVGITGVAGPGGGSREKPVGLVYIALSCMQHITVIENYFSGTRTENKRMAVEKALIMIQDEIRSIDG